MIKYKCLVYNNLFISLYDELEVKKKKIDLYFKKYQFLNAYIQMSIIFLSILSSFIQALDAELYKFIFNVNDNIIVDSYTDIKNITHSNTTIYDEDSDYTEFNTIKKGYTLFIGMYTAIFIALERHYKYQQKENNIEILKNSYSEPVSIVDNNLQIIRPWLYKHYYMKSLDNDIDEKNYDNEKLKEWITFVTKIDKEYHHVIDIKKNLDITYGKLINSNNKIEKKIKKNDTINDINYKYNLPMYKYKYHSNSSQLSHIKKLIKNELDKENKLCNCKIKCKKYKSPTIDKVSLDDENIKKIIRKEINKNRCCKYYWIFNCFNKDKDNNNDNNNDNDNTDLNNNNLENNIESEQLYYDDDDEDNYLEILETESGNNKIKKNSKTF